MTPATARQMKSDGIIFDMDGTLWDAVDSYATIWNRAIADMRLDLPPVRRPALEKMMGLPLDRIYDGLIGLPEVSGPFMALLERLESELMPRLGGRLYPGVRETLEALRAGGARLFMVSNCGPDGLPNFLEYTGLGELMTDCLSLGENGLDKTQNILELIGRYNLGTPVYVGDTAGDLAYTHAAGIPFVWAAYGFGRDVNGAEYIIHSIRDLLRILQ